MQYSIFKEAVMFTNDCISIPHLVVMYSTLCYRKLFGARVAGLLLLVDLIILTVALVVQNCIFNC